MSNALWSSGRPRATSAGNCRMNGQGLSATTYTRYSTERTENMSHRVTTQTQITNKDLAVQALKSAGWSYDANDSTIRITSGPMRNSSINVRTGTVTGDSDYHNRGTLGALCRHYAEAVIRAEAAKNGHTVESREVLQNGDFRLVLTANFG